MSLQPILKNVPVFVIVLGMLAPFTTIDAQKSGNAISGTIRLSSYSGGFEAFIQEAVRTGKLAVIDKDVAPQGMIEVDGDLRVEGLNTPTIHHGLPVLFTLKSGKHEFKNFNIIQESGAVAFFTFVQQNIIWDNHIIGIHITGGRQAYLSSRGGLYDPSIDAVQHWSGTTIEDCVFKTSFVCVSVFSQDGPGKFLHMRNVDLYSDTAHNLYVHPNVSLKLYNVRSMKVGNPGLAIHHYSGGGGENGKGVPSNARYVEIRKCYTNWQPAMKGGMWQIAEPITGVVIMDSCDLAPYSIPLPHMMATNTRFFNGGGGAFVKGKLFNCTGTVWPSDETDIDRCDFDEINLRNGGNILVKNTKVKTVFGDQKPVNIVFENTAIEAMNISNPKPSKVLLKKGSKIKTYLWNWKPAAGLLLDESRKN